MKVRTVNVCVFIAAAAFSLQCAAKDGAPIREEFKDLKRWEPFTFPKIKRHSKYTVHRDDEVTFLKATSRASASALKCKEAFNPFDYPVLEWRWKVDNVLKKGDAMKKKGDDYPLRLYVIFDEPKGSGGFFGGIKKFGAKLATGQDLPHSSLNYIWANHRHKKRILPNPYTGRAQMVILRQGKKDVGKWVGETVNILKDYREAFGEDPPRIAHLAIMSDTDNTGEAATAYVDFIELRKKK